MAVIKTWDSITDYDTALKEIAHYRIHPEMLPYIGEHYKETKLMLVGESHYIEAADLDAEHHQYFNNEWYKNPVPDNFLDRGAFETRGVIRRFLTLRRGRSYSMFWNPANALIENWGLNGLVCDSDAFSSVCFMNYFQKPASEAGETICYTKDDNDVAAKTLKAVIEVLSPNRIIFLSKKAYEAFEHAYETMPENICIDYVNHPTSPHWYKENGKEKYIRLIKDVPVPILDQHAPVSERKLCKLIDRQQILGQQCVLTKRKRFYDDRTTCQMYGEKDNIFEIVFRRILGGDKIGIGFRIDYQLIWVWNYSKEEYIDAVHDSPYPGLDDLYQGVLKFVDKIPDVFTWLYPGVLHDDSM